jgi:hypothetical protein
MHKTLTSVELIGANCIIRDLVNLKLSVEFNLNVEFNLKLFLWMLMIIVP